MVASSKTMMLVSKENLSSAVNPTRLLYMNSDH